MFTFQTQLTKRLGQMFGHQQLLHVLTELVRAPQIPQVVAQTAMGQSAPLSLEVTRSHRTVLGWEETNKS